MRDELVDLTYICYVVGALAGLVFLEELFGRSSIFSVCQRGSATCMKPATDRASSNSSSPFSNIFSFLYCSKNAFRFRSLSYWSIMRLNNWRCDAAREVLHKLSARTGPLTEATLVWFASMSPLTR